MARIPRGLHNTQPKPNATETILSKDILTEGDVRLLMRRVNADWGEALSASGIAIINQLSSKDGGYTLTPEQVEKGRRWLEKHRRDMGYRESAVMDDFADIRLVGTASGEYNNYQYPYYRVRSQPDAEGHRSTFDYKVEGGELHIG